MVLIILVALLVLGIAFYQAIQGIYSALIMAVLTVLCAALAFNYYEPLASALLYTRQPASADAIMLIALFTVPLLVLRLIIDSLLHSNVVLNVWVSRIGGAVLGLLTSLILVGVLTVAVQMLPVRESFLYYRPYDATLHRASRLAPFYPDEFAVGLINTLSAGGLGAAEGRTFRDAHDDLLLELFCARNTAGKSGRCDAMPDDMRLVGLYDPQDDQVAWAQNVPANPLLNQSDLPNIIIARVNIDPKARDKDNWWRLPATHFRLVGQSGRSYYPVAYLSYDSGQWAVHAPPLKDGAAQVADLIVARPYGKEASAGVTIDWVYKIPADDKPARLHFRRVAVQRVGKVVQNQLPPSQGALDRTYESKSARRRGARRR